MKRAWRVPVIFLASCLLTGCPGIQHIVTAPPEFSAERAIWWAHFVDAQDLDFLAFLIDVSDALRDRDATATYSSSFIGRTMIATFFFQSDLPLPMPKTVEEWARERVIGHTPGAKAPTGLNQWHGDEASMAVWNGVARQRGWGDDRSW